MSISKITFLLAIVASACLTATGRAEDLAASVAGKLRDSGALAGYRVNVKAKSGTVWLEGRVSDEKQLSAAVGIAETTPGVERVVNRLVIEGNGKNAANPAATNLALPSSAWGAAGVEQPVQQAAPQAVPEASTTKSPFAVLAGGFLFPTPPAAEAAISPVQLVRGGTPPSQPRGKAPPRNGASRQRPMPMGPPQARPMGPPQARPMNAGRPQDPRYRTAMRTGMQEPMTLPGPGGYEGPVADGQMVPGTMQYSDGYAPGAGPAGGAGGPVAGPGMGPGMGGAPMAMGGTGAGMPPVPMRADGPNMPNYAWPSYAAYPNYAALQYPTQYSPTAWPYIGPFYPYPQVPLGWRRVSLEWDDGWWWLDFDNRHYHSHHN